LPVPLAPPVIVIQDAMLAAVHAQPAAALTLKVPVPGPPAIELLVGEMVAAHDAVNAY
jgi:hypothetical protein